MVQKASIPMNAMMIRVANKQANDNKYGPEAVIQIETSFLKIASNLGVATQKTPTNSKEHNSGLPNT